MSQAGFHSSRFFVGFALILVISACASPRPRPEPVAEEHAPEVAALPSLLKSISSPAGKAYRHHSPFGVGTPARAVCPEWMRIQRRGAARSPSLHAFHATFHRILAGRDAVVTARSRGDRTTRSARRIRPVAYVESAYQTLPTKGKGPRGIWQLMAHTAIDRGLQVNRGYDQRLDILASTGVALDLIERYDREFSDWRLASMAFNAGEYRVKARAGRDARGGS